MDYFSMGEYDVIVVGAGHAGCEAGLACARMGQTCLMLSINLEAVAMMACNPSIGGIVFSLCYGPMLAWPVVLTVGLLGHWRSHRRRR